ncbi:MAG: hypothetical protein ACKVWV_06215 [Planctomycetota bacterium]
MATFNYGVRSLGVALLALAPATASHAQCLQWGPPSGFTDLAGPTFTSSSVLHMRAFDDGGGAALYAAGKFRLVNGTQATNIARWLGGAWSAVGGGVSSGGSESVSALASYSSPAGPRLLAAIRTSAFPRIEQWDGASWSSFDDPSLFDPFEAVECLAEYTPPGSAPQMYVGTSVGKLLRYDGTSWSTLFGANGGAIHALKVLMEPTGPVLVMSGEFGTGSHPPGPGGSVALARYDGATWSAMGDGTRVGDLVAFDAPDGVGSELYSTHTEVLPSSYVIHVVRWNGASWTTIGSVTSPSLVGAMAVSCDGTSNGQRLYVGGTFSSIDGVAANDIATWDGTSWSALDSSDPGQVMSLCAYNDGSDAAADLYMGGRGVVAEVRAWRGCTGPGEGFCFADGSLATSCPCAAPANVPVPGGSPFSGCGNSFNPIGASLVASGATNPDSITLHASGTTPAGFTIFIKGDAEIVDGVVRHDGVLCAGGAFIRFGSQNAVNGTASYPNLPLGHVTPLSVLGGTAPGSAQTAYYQAFYRNVAANFCTSGTLNLTNAYQVAW